MITSLTNPKIKQLQQVQKRSKVRREADVFIIEGSRLFCEVPVEHIKEVYVTQNFLDKLSETNGNEVRETARQLSETAYQRLQSMPYEIVSEEVFAKISDTVTPQGILCVVRCFHYELETLLHKEKPFFLMLEDIQDPGNLGTMIRTAEGAGIDGILMSKGCVDIYNPKVVRGTMGSIFRMPFVYLEDLPSAERLLCEQGFQIYAAALDGAVEYTEVNYKGKAAVLVGNEGNGLTKEAISSSTQPVFIPMEGKVESLNASISAAILMYHGKAERNRG